MTRVRLEIDEVQIHRPKKRWKLYFLVVTDHPTEEDKMIITTLPHQPFKLSRRHDNSFQFDTDDAGSNGLFVLSRDTSSRSRVKRSSLSTAYSKSHQRFG